MDEVETTARREAEIFGLRDAVAGKSVLCLTNELGWDAELPAARVVVANGVGTWDQAPFDAVVCYGHLDDARDPIGALAFMREMTRGAFFLEIAVLEHNRWIPMSLSLSEENGGSPVFVATEACLVSWLDAAGWERIFIVDDAVEPRFLNRARIMATTGDDEWTGLAEGNRNLRAVNSDYWNGVRHHVVQYRRRATEEAGAF